MKKKSHPLPLVITLILFSASPLVSRLPGEAPAAVLINPGSPGAGDTMRGWRTSFERGRLQEWGRSRNLAVVDDREPVVDHVAAYVSPAGSRIVVPGLSRGARYRLWIDFVRFRGPGEIPPTMLRITAVSPGGGAIHLADIRPGDLHEDYYHVDLPPGATVRGVAEILFTEYAPRPGCWGVWDIIIAEGDALPVRSELPAERAVDLEIKERIVE